MSSSHPTKSSRTTIYVIVGLVASFVIFCCIFPLVYGLTTETMRSIGLLPTLTPRHTPTYTSTPSPTDTPVPTDTPQPTSTPEPTKTPVPTDTPVLTPAEPPLEVQLYVLEMATKIQTLGESLGDLSELLQNPRLTDADWTLAIAMEITVIRLAHEELTEMDVPLEMTEIHNAILDATSDCNASMDYLTSGIDNLNVTDLETAATLMTSCSEKIEKPAEMIEEYMAQFE